MNGINKRYHKAMIYLNYLAETRVPKSEQAKKQRDRRIGKAAKKAAVLMHAIFKTQRPFAA